MVGLGGGVVGDGAAVGGGVGLSMASVGVGAGVVSAHAVQTSSAAMAKVLPSEGVQLDRVAMVCCRLEMWQLAGSGHMSSTDQNDSQVFLDLRSMGAAIRGARSERERD